MRVEFRMPDIGEGIAEFEILEWLVGLGQTIVEDQPVVSIQTDKAVVEIPTPTGGVVAQLGGAAGDILPIGTVLMTIETTGASAPAAAAEQSNPPAVRPGPDAAPSRPEPTVAPPTAQRRPLAAPVVRKLALELGIDLHDVVGTGEGGRITRDDVLAAGSSPVTAPAPAPAPLNAPAAQAVAPATSRTPADDVRVPLRGLRRTIAKKMTETWQTVPHITDYREVHATALIEARRQIRQAFPASVEAMTFVPLFVKITAAALRSNPLLNASFDDQAQEYVLHGRINIGIATSTDDGLLVPVVHDADTKSVLELADEIRDLVRAARERKATNAQLTGGTYTVNNLGALGGWMSTPLIRTPEVGILGFGRIMDRVVPVDGVPAVRPILVLSSVGDHRLHDGDTLSAFTNSVIRLIENPFVLLAELR